MAGEPDAEGNQQLEMEYEKEEIGDIMQLFPQKPKRESGFQRRTKKQKSVYTCSIWSRTFLKEAHEKGALINGRDDYYREDDWDLKGADCRLLQSGALEGVSDENIRIEK